MLWERSNSIIFSIFLFFMGVFLLPLYSKGLIGIDSIENMDKKATRDVPVKVKKEIGKKKSFLKDLKHRVGRDLIDFYDRVLSFLKKIELLELAYRIVFALLVIAVIRFFGGF